MNSSTTAMEAQGLISKMTTRNLELTRLLDQSAGADGVVRQLQVVNELLALSTGHLLDLSTALIATGRMTSTMTAMSAAQDRVASEAAFIARKNYTSRGKSVPVLTELPRIP
jgi:P-type conjugative transfer protein TrbJ